MAVPHDIQYGRVAARHGAPGNDRGEARTKTLGVLVAVMVAAGVVALIMTVFGNDSNNSQAATQPVGSQVGRATSSVPGPGASTTGVAPASTTPAGTTPAGTTPAGTTPAGSKPASSTPPASVPVTAKPASTRASASTSTKIVKYKVRKGDNLTLIAKWFSQRGVAPVYDWNKSVIGKNPNLIYPGQTIIVSLKGDKMNVSTKNK